MWYSVRFHKVLPNTWKVATHVAHAVPSSFLMTQFWRHNSCSAKAGPGYFFKIYGADLFFKQRTQSQSTILTWSYLKLNQKCFPYLGNLNIILQRLVSLTNNFLQSRGLGLYIFKNWDFTPLLHIFVFSKDFLS